MFGNLPRYTFIVIPDEAGQTSRFTIPKCLVMLLFLFVVCVVTGIGTLWVGYLRVSATVTDYDRLKAENHSLRSEAAAISAKLQEVQDSLSAVDSFSSQLRKATEVDSKRGGQVRIREKSNPARNVDNKSLPTSNPSKQNTTYKEVPRDIGPLTKEDYAIVRKNGNAPNEIAPSINFEKLEFRDLFERLMKVNRKTSTQALELERLMKEVQSYQTRLSIMPTLAPSVGYISSSFGMRESPFSGQLTMHWGVDISAPVGSAIRAAAAGRVVATRYADDYGNFVDVDHGGGIATRYAHISKIIVTAGSLVNKGDTIALVGMTGRTTGPHVHYEVEVNGRRVDPEKYIKGW